MSDKNPEFSGDIIFGYVRHRRLILQMEPPLFVNRLLKLCCLIFMKKKRMKRRRRKNQRRMKRIRNKKKTSKKRRFGWKKKERRGKMKNGDGSGRSGGEHICSFSFPPLFFHLFITLFESFFWFKLFFSVIFFCSSNCFFKRNGIIAVNVG